MNDASDTQHLDPLGWRRDSVCRKHPTQWWFAGGAQETHLAKDICSGCSVQAPCLEFALDRPDLLGIWAATTPTERVTMRRENRSSVETGDATGCEPAKPVALTVPIGITTARQPQPDTNASAPEPKRRGAYGPSRPSTRDVGLTDSNERTDGGTDRTGRDELLTPAEAAHCLGVTPNTVTRWSRAGKISAIQTMGGHRRFRRSEIERVLRDANLVSHATT